MKRGLISRYKLIGQTGLIMPALLYIFIPFRRHTFQQAYRFKNLEIDFGMLYTSSSLLL
jgi:hypothetical protein